jgi:hypothetical protein
MARAADPAAYEAYFPLEDVKRARTASNPIVTLRSGFTAGARERFLVQKRRPIAHRRERGQARRGQL